MEMDRYGRVVECLGICIAKYETHIMDAFLVHVVDCIAATATNTDDLNIGAFLFGFAEI